jgi:hypothetical protein
MNELDTLYAKLLSLGFVVLREAVFIGRRDWIEAELEMLHNVPTLLGEDNLERHRYYWFSERQHYINWASSPGREQAKSRMLTYYEPIWREMEPLIVELMELDCARETQVPTEY